MALDIKLCAEVDPYCKGLYVKDITGSYDAESNPGGYGAPNPEVDDIFWYTIYIDGTENNPAGYDALGILPNNILFLPGTVTNNSGGTLQDMLDAGGPITVAANILSPGLSLGSVDILTYCPQSNIVKNLFAQIATPGCCDDCRHEKECLSMEAYHALLSLEFAASSGNTAKFNELVELINSYSGLDLCKC